MKCLPERAVLRRLSEPLIRRPLVLTCLLLAEFLLALHLLGVPLVPESREMKNVREALSAGENKVSLTGYVRSRRIEADYPYIVLERVTAAVGETQYRIQDVKITLAEPFAYEIGTFLGVSGKLKEIEKPTNPGQFDRAFYYAVQKIGFTMTRPEITTLGKKESILSEAIEKVRERVLERIEAVYPEDVRGPLAAMLAGDRSFLSDEDNARYRMGGVSHILAISGLHITVLAMGFYRLLLLLHMDYRAAAAASVVWISLYAVMTGLSASTVRAVIMFIFLMGARVFKRTYDLPTAAAFAAILLLLENPLYLFYSGFILSFGAVCCLNVFAGRSRFAGGVLLALVMMPAVLYYFYEIPLLGVPVNLVIVPLLPVVLFTGAAGLVPGGIFSLPAAFLLRLIRQMLALCAGVPYASLILGRPSAVRIVIYLTVLSGFLYLCQAWRTKKRRFFLLLAIPLLVLILGFRVRSGIKMTFLDVGQGDSCVLELPGGENILTDGGSSSADKVGNERILPFLQFEGIRHLDYVIVTHMDSDHTSGITELLTAVRDKTTSLTVGCLALPYRREPDESLRMMARLAAEAGARVIEVRSGDEIRFGKGAVVEILGPDPDIETLSPDNNAGCIVCHVSCGAFDALMTGDVEGPGEDALIKKLSSGRIDCEVLKVAHHGSNNSTPKEFLDLVHPDIAVISAGAGNPYGHPAAELLLRLEEGAGKVLRTDRNGAITVFSDGKSLFYETIKAEKAS